MDCYYLSSAVGMDKSNKFLWIDSELHGFVSGSMNKNADNFMRELKNRYDDLSPVRTDTPTWMMSSALSRFISLMTDSEEFRLAPQGVTDQLDKLMTLAKETIENGQGTSSTFKILAYYIICILYVERIKSENGYEEYNYTHELYKSGIMKVFRKLTALIDAYNFEEEMKSGIYSEPLSLKSLESLPDYYSELISSRYANIPDAVTEFNDFKLAVHNSLKKALVMDSFKGNAPIKFATNPYGEQGLIKKMSSIGFDTPEAIYDVFFGKQNGAVSVALSDMTISATDEGVSFEVTIKTPMHKEVGTMQRTFAWDKSYISLDSAVIYEGFQTKPLYKQLLEGQLKRFKALGFAEVRVHVSGGMSGLVFAGLGFDFVDIESSKEEIMKSFVESMRNSPAESSAISAATAKLQAAPSAKEISRLTIPSKFPELLDLGAYVLLDTEWDARLSL